ncbi:uncharacterized protein BCN122_II1609 [Burkholderia cenocepacia]|nr:uncharacterized protein BCN122_II1609 [Burkholderia cenocepacia]
MSRRRGTPPRIHPFRTRRPLPTIQFRNTLPVRTWPARSRVT